MADRLITRVEPRAILEERIVPGWVEICDDGGWLTAVCPWCDAVVGEGCVFGDAGDNGVPVVACPSCFRESAIWREAGVKTIALRLMSPADMAYLRWRATRTSLAGDRHG